MTQFDAAHAHVSMIKCIEACVDFYNSTDKDKVHLYNKKLIKVYNAGEFASETAIRLNKQKEGAM